MRTKTALHGAWLLICTALALSRPVPALAQGSGRAEPTPWGATEGTLYFPTPDGAGYLPAPVLETEVELRVTGPIARATVRQRFRNPTPDWVEGLYVFPLPQDAAVDGMRLRAGDRVIEGRIREKAAARRAYGDARDSGRAASLVEQKRPNVFTTEVANIAPDGEVSVSIDYQQTLRFDAGAWQLRFPMVVAPRYASDAGEAPQDLTPADLVEMLHGAKPAPAWLAGTLAGIAPAPDAPRAPADGGLIHPVRLSIHLDAGVAIGSVSSPSHALAIRAPAPERREIGVRAWADRDFVLRWMPRAAAVPAAAVFAERGRDDASVLLIVQPPAEEFAPRGIAREVVIAIDKSGSMGGASIRQAREALLAALERLAPGDWFNVIAFDSEVRALFEESRPVDAARLERAREFVRALEADGGTEIGAALDRALSPAASAPDALRQVVFITDGSVANEAELFERVRARLGPSRLFAVGIGSAPNGFLLARIARFGRGTYTFVSSPSEVRERIGELFDKLERPALRDVEVIWNDEVEMWPERVPDLYAGEPLVVTARVARFAGDVRVRGRIGGRAWEQRLRFEPDAEAAGIGKLWARAKIAALMDGLSGGADAETVRKEVTAVALGYGLVSRFTSLVAVDTTPVRPADAVAKRAVAPLNAPRGWAHPADAPLPRAATPAALWMIAGAGCALTGLAGVGRGRCRRSR